MRTVMTWSILLVMVGALAFAGGNQEAAPAPVADQETEVQGPVEIEFWTTQTQSDRLATIQVLVDTFQALNPDITINVIPVDENDMSTQVAAAAAANTLPALGEFGAETAVALGAEGVIDVGANSEVINSIGSDRFYQGALRMVGDGQGSYYAVPFHGWIQGIWYRADWFDEAGLDVPRTWDEILEAAEYFYSPQDNQYGILVGTTAEAFTEQVFTQFARSNGAALFNREGDLVFNSPEMREAIEYYAELAQYNPPGPQTWRARDYYLQDKMAMFFYSTYIMDDLAIEDVAAGSLTNENFGDLEGASFDPELVENTRLSPIITNSQDAGYGVIVSLSLFDQGDDAKTAAAQQFMQYLFTPNAYVTYLHMAPGGMNPVLPEVTSNPRFLNDPSGVYSNYGGEKMGEITSGLESIESFGIVDGRRIEAASVIFERQIIPQMLFAITQEDADIDAAMAEAEAQMMEILEDM
ncbi:MAG TPA: extracellular solute-binding protein [Alkalispirochaeta sp.]|nr:extracellular solute-binding protein [Alkalispirochaeta sp.]